jgi:hypothetical protein
MLFVLGVHHPHALVKEDLRRLFLSSSIEVAEGIIQHLGAKTETLSKARLQIDVRCTYLNA